MTDSFGTVCIVGVGLLGGSLGLALKSRGAATTVYGVGRRQSSLDTAVDRGAIDEGHLELSKAVPQADLVIVCTPAAGIPGFLEALRPLCASSAIITDVASTKEVICQCARSLWDAPLPFIGSHPMAGSEKSGPEYADPGLFEGAVTFVEKADDLDGRAKETVARLWETVGSVVVEVDPSTHDRLVARTSHVPHIAASALATLVEGHHGIGPFIGAGFRDTTRVADGRPEIWRDICLTNTKAIHDALGELIARLEDVRASVLSEDAEALNRFFVEARVLRQNILES